MAQAEIAERQTEQVIRFAAGQRWRRAGAFLVGWVGFIAIWIIISRFVVGPYLLPDPLRVGAHMWEVVKSGLFIRHYPTKPMPPRPFTAATITTILFMFSANLCLASGSYVQCNGKPLSNSAV